MKGVLVEGKITPNVAKKAIELLGTDQYYEVSQTWWDDRNNITATTYLMYTDYEGDMSSDDVDHIVCMVGDKFHHDYMEELDDNKGVLDIKDMGLHCYLESNYDQRVDILGWFKTYTVQHLIVERDIEL